MMTAQKKLAPIGKRVSLYPTKHTIKTPDRIAITMKNRIEIIATEQILHLRADSNYTHVYLTTGVHFLVCNTLKSFEQILQVPDFLRIHQSHIIQMQYLRAFDPGHGVVHLDGADALPVSRERKQELMQYLKSLMIH